MGTLSILLFGALCLTAVSALRFHCPTPVVDTIEKAERKCSGKDEKSLCAFEELGMADDPWWTWKKKVHWNKIKAMYVKKGKSQLYSKCYGYTNPSDSSIWDNAMVKFNGIFKVRSAKSISHDKQLEKFTGCTKRLAERECAIKRSAHEAALRRAKEARRRAVAARKAAAEAARREKERIEKEKRLMEEARKAAEEAKRAAAEAARKAAEEKRRREEAERRRQEEEERRRLEEEERRRQEEEEREKQRLIEEEKQRQYEEEQRRLKEEEERKKLEAEQAEAARLAALRAKQEEEARIAEEKRRAAEEEARRLKEEEDRRKEEERLRREEAERLRLEEEREMARLQAEREAEAARKKAEEEAKEERRRQEEERLRQEAERLRILQEEIEAAKAKAHEEAVAAHNEAEKARIDAETEERQSQLAEAEALAEEAAGAAQQALEDAKAAQVEFEQAKNDLETAKELEEAYEQCVPDHPIYNAIVNPSFKKSCFKQYFKTPNLCKLDKMGYAIRIKWGKFMRVKWYDLQTKLFADNGMEDMFEECGGKVKQPNDPALWNQFSTKADILATPEEQVKQFFEMTMEKIKEKVCNKPTHDLEMLEEAMAEAEINQLTASDVAEVANQEMVDAKEALGELKQSFLDNPIPPSCPYVTPDETPEGPEEELEENPEECEENPEEPEEAQEEHEEEPVENSEEPEENPEETPEENPEESEENPEEPEENPEEPEAEPLPENPTTGKAHRFATDESSAYKNVDEVYGIASASRMALNSCKGGSITKAKELIQMMHKFDMDADKFCAWYRETGASATWCKRTFRNLLDWCTEFNDQCNDMKLSPTTIIHHWNTVPGEDLVIRGGKIGCEGDDCGIRVVLPQKGEQWNEYSAWSKGAFELSMIPDCQTEPDQNGVTAAGLPMRYTTNDENKDHYDEMNNFGSHYWILDMDMDCEDNEWFWFDIGIVRGGQVEWSSDIDTPACGNVRSKGFPNNRRYAKCGATTKFDANCEINP